MLPALGPGLDLSADVCSAAKWERSGYLLCKDFMRIKIIYVKHLPQCLPERRSLSVSFSYYCYIIITIIIIINSDMFWGELKK